MASVLDFDPVLGPATLIRPPPPLNLISNLNSRVLLRGSVASRYYHLRSDAERSLRIATSYARRGRQVHVRINCMWN
jgi:hypothetical protein